MVPTGRGEREKEDLACRKLSIFLNGPLFSRDRRSVDTVVGDDCGSRSSRLILKNAAGASHASARFRKPLGDQSGVILLRLSQMSPIRELAPAAYPGNPGAMTQAPICGSSPRLSVQLPEPVAVDPPTTSVEWPHANASFAWAAKPAQVGAPGNDAVRSYNVSGTRQTPERMIKNKNGSRT